MTEKLVASARRSLRRLRLAAGALAVVAVTVAAASAAVPAPAHQATPIAGPGDVYLPLGDSIAAGIGATRPGERGYAALLDGYLSRQAGHAVELVNLAVPGETTASMRTGGQLDRAVRVLAEERRSGRRISPITLTIGANDLLRAGDDPAARERAVVGAEANLHAILAAIRQAIADPRGRAASDLIVTGYADPTGSDPSRAGSDAWWAARLNAVIAREAAAAGGRMVDLAPLFRDHERTWTWYPTDIHPTNAGHRAIADAVWRATGYDTTPPSIRIERPAAGFLPRPIPTVAAAVTDRVGVTEVDLWVDGVFVAPLTYLPDLGRYATLWDARSAPPGRHTLGVRAVDAAGNVASASVTVEVPAAGQASPASLPSPVASPDA